MHFIAMCVFIFFAVYGFIKFFETPKTSKTRKPKLVVPQYKLTAKGEAMANELQQKQDNKLAKSLLYFYLALPAIGVIYMIYGIATI